MVFNHTALPVEYCDTVGTAAQCALTVFLMVHCAQGIDTS